MQELTIPPQSTAPYTPAGGSNMPSAPRLGTPIPGTTGGLPTQQGLNVASTPLDNSLQSQQPQPQQSAQQVQSYGRGNDSMLVHMTPDEVNSLRGLAQRFGGDLTVNPNTGLPEAGWLGKLLPTILGAAGMLIPGAAPWMIAAGVGAGQTALTGDLGKGLMAGLQAFGGASLAGAAGVGGGAGSAVTGAAPDAAVNLAPGAARAAATSGLTIPADIAAMGSSAAAPTLGSVALQGAPSLGGAIASQAPTSLLSSGAAAAPAGGFFSKFGAAAKTGLPKGMLQKYAPIAAGLGTLSAVSDATAPNLPKYEEEEDNWNYAGVRRPTPRRLYPTATGTARSSEIMFFPDSNPMPGYAEGGEAEVVKEVVYGGAPAPAAGLGTTAAAMMPALAQMYNTSPGAITASKTYAEAPSARIRAEAAANAVKKAATTPEVDYGFKQIAPPPPTLGLTGTDNYLSPYFGSMTLEEIGEYVRPYWTNSMSGPRDVFNTNVQEKATGGTLHMDDGGFVMPARETAEFGNGSTEAGWKRLTKMGGIPIRGDGDGVSDSIKASIGGKQEARVADGETYFPPQAVKKLGGAKKLHALMRKAEGARKKAKRGQDTGLRRGLA
jgi:hypothetical protein